MIIQNDEKPAPPHHPSHSAHCPDGLTAPLKDIIITAIFINIIIIIISIVTIIITVITSAIGAVLRNVSNFLSWILN